MYSPCLGRMSVGQLPSKGVLPIDDRGDAEDHFELRELLRILLCGGMPGVLQRGQ